MTEYKLNTKGVYLVNRFCKFQELAGEFLEENDIGPLTESGYLAWKLLKATNDDLKILPKAIKDWDAEDVLQLMDYITKINGHEE
jgi:hypothetical protein